MSDKKSTDASEKKPDRQSLNPMQVIGSVFAAGLGVQSSKNRERDFNQGNFKVFVISGIVFTLLFIGAVFTIVKMVLAD